MPKHDDLGLGMSARTQRHSVRHEGVKRCRAHWDGVSRACEPGKRGERATRPPEGWRSGGNHGGVLRGSDTPLPGAWPESPGICRHSSTTQHPCSRCGMHLLGRSSCHPRTHGSASVPPSRCSRSEVVRLRPERLRMASGTPVQWGGRSSLDRQGARGVSHGWELFSLWREQYHPLSPRSWDAPAEALRAKIGTASPYIRDQGSGSTLSDRSIDRSEA